MNVEQLVFSQDEAVKLLHRYQTHKNYQKQPIDAEVEHIAKMISKGKVLIRGRGSVIGRWPQRSHLPKLAIARADAPWCRLDTTREGGAR